MLIIQSERFYLGSILTISGPCVLIIFTSCINHGALPLVQVCKKNLINTLPNLAKKYNDEKLEVTSLDEFVVQSTIYLLQHIGYQIFDNAIIKKRSLEKDRIEVYIPAFDTEGRYTKAIFRWMLNYVNIVASKKSLSEHFKVLRKLLAHASTESPQGLNTQYFIQAARELTIPYRRLSGNIFIFGLGLKSYRLDSSFTQMTSAIAIGIARDKRKTRNLLRMAGLPIVSRQYNVTSYDQAIKQAQDLGWPVVLKPHSMDGGKNVFAGLKNAESLKNAFDKLDKLNNRCGLIVEPFVAGKDYRLQVFNGVVFRAIERVPAGITGDGVRTVSELVIAENLNPLRGDRLDMRSPLKRLELNEEAIELLRDQSLSVHDIPKSNQFIRLSNTANIATGGTPVSVIDTVHPDNLAMASRAIQIIGLDLGGVDIIMPDISKSWMEGNAAIIEVNAQPQLGPGQQHEILKQLIDGDGRIPVIFIVGNYDELKHHISEVCDKLDQKDINLGIGHQNGVTINSESVARASLSAYRAGEILAIDRLVGAILLIFDDLMCLSDGLAFDMVDTLIVALPFEKSKAITTELLEFSKSTIFVDQEPPLSSVTGSNIKTIPKSKLIDTIVDVVLVKRG